MDRITLLFGLVFAFANAAEAQQPPGPPPVCEQRDAPPRPRRQRPPPAEPDEFDNVPWGPLSGSPFANNARGRPTPSPADLRQGGIGDCWLISSLAAVAARRPQHIVSGLRTRLGQDQQGRPLTIHSIRVFIDGKPENFDVTNHVPVNQIPLAAVSPLLDPFSLAAITVGDLQVPIGPRYAQLGPQGQTWGPLFERAMADAAGGYSRIGNGGNGATALTMITGQPSVQFDPNDRNLTFADFAALARTNAIVVGTARVGVNRFFQSDTLITNHAYWVDTVDARVGTVTVRNPHNYNDAVTLPWADFRLAFTTGARNPMVAPRAPAAAPGAAIPQPTAPH